MLCRSRDYVDWYTRWIGLLPIQSLHMTEGCQCKVRMEVLSICIAIVQATVIISVCYLYSVYRWLFWSVWIVWKRCSGLLKYFTSVTR
ncbi:hypothetical protein BCR37DRAFT_377958 [Protomyces lactucae-debilis]|uniref:Uncharacterized protein n=1 Tax=Protomyces lactucae-debilis TaxID=2754530 RepID=A0A1Y2FN31_PROLT|nr:uncharacterized protein BCR37DRAFT_377958 [Protomyces lactucae-debilis]ORY84987.1 hypothetical protein BCR37DRAFT_377958 [Protomyces lactucae-debilis]